MTSIGEHILLGGRWVCGRQISGGDSRFAPYFIFAPGGLAAGEHMTTRQRLLYYRDYRG
jgi:hypothetical protein